MTAQTPEEAYAVFEALLKFLTVAERSYRPTLHALALRAGLNPVLAPYREDPLLTIAGEFVSLDARISSLFEDVCRTETASSALKDIPEYDLWTLGEPEFANVDASDPGDSFVGSIGCAVYIPARLAAVGCRARAYFAPGDDLDRVGWEPPIAIRNVSAAIRLSAENALRAALMFLSERGLLPRRLLPGVIYYDLCGREVDEDALPQISGDSLGVPLLLAFLSALTGAPISENVGATGALEPPTFDRAIRLNRVQHVAEKAAAFSATLPHDSANFLAVAAVQTGYQGFTAIVTVDDALALALPELPARAHNLAAASNSSGASEAGRPSVFLAAILETEESRTLSATEMAAWRDIAILEVVRCCGLCQPDRGGDRPGAIVIRANFPTIEFALSAAESMLTSLRFCPWPSGGGTADAILPGIGIHCEDQNHFGTPRDPERHATRIAEVASSGYVFLSEQAQRLVTDDRVAVATITGIGTYRLRDLAPPIPLWLAEFRRVDASGRALRALAPHAPRSLDNYPHNLPFEMTPTFGREEEVETVRRLLSGAASASRLTSIVGSGGVGKTRVALESGAGALAAFPDGAWHVRIDTDVRSSEDVALIVTESLPFTFTADMRHGVSDETYLKSVIATFANLKLLLILDGCEATSVNTAVAHFATALLTAAPSTAILVTARTPLGLPAETIHRLGPLKVAAIDPRPEASHVASSPAYDLFCSRARLAGTDLRNLATADRFLVADLCRRLEGSPLAIEVAASHLSALPLGAIASGIAAITTAPESRSQVLNRLFEWAFERLGRQDQDLLCALSTFRDGFDSEAASFLCGESDDPDAPLRDLENRSLVRQRLDGSGRYDLHSLIQSFARRKLSASGRELSARLAHARYFLVFVARLGGDEPNAERERAAYDRLDLDLNNIRAAVEFLRTHEIESVPKIIVDSANFLRRRGHLREWRAWPALALRLLPDVGELPSAIHARAQLCRAASLMDANSPHEAAKHVESAYAAAIAAGAWDTAAKALNLRSLLCSRAEHWDDALTALLEARALNQRIGSEYGEIIALNQLGLLAARQSKNAEARDWFEAAESLSRAIDDRRGLAIAIGNLGYLALDDNDYTTAQRYFEEGLVQGRALHDASRIANGLVNLGDVLNRQNDWESGTPLLAIGEAILVRQRHHNLTEAVRCLAEAAPHYGADRLESLRRGFGKRSIAQLLSIDPARYVPRRLRL